MNNLIRHSIYGSILGLVAVALVSWLASCAPVAAGVVGLTATSCLNQEQAELDQLELDQSLDAAAELYEAGDVDGDEYRELVSVAFKEFGDALSTNVVSSTVGAVGDEIRQAGHVATAGGGLIGGAATLLLNLYRNRTRRDDLVEVTGKTPKRLERVKK